MNRQTVAIPLHQGVSRPMGSGILSKSIREWVQKRNTTRFDIISKGIGTFWEVKSLNPLNHP